MKFGLKTHQLNPFGKDVKRSINYQLHLFFKVSSCFVGLSPIPNPNNLSIV